MHLASKLIDALGLMHLRLLTWTRLYQFKNNSHSAAREKIECEGTDSINPIMWSKDSFKGCIIGVFSDHRRSV